MGKHYKDLNIKFSQYKKEPEQTEGRRLQFSNNYNFYTPRTPAPMISRVNAKYHNDRRTEVESSEVKNPFDKRSNHFPGYSGFNQKRSNKFTSNTYNRSYSSTIFIDGIEIPAEVNWNKYNNFTPVKDQRDCNACYAFGGISGLEAHHVIFNNNWTTYSEQELLDCSLRNNQCLGG